MVRSVRGTEGPAGEPGLAHDPGFVYQVHAKGAALKVGVGRSPHISVSEPRPAEWPSVETAIVLQVTAALLAEPPTELTVIEVNSEQGIVTLKGQVGSVRLQSMAGEIASKHPGVEGTVNDLQIRERGGTDSEVDGPS